MTKEITYPYIHPEGSFEYVPADDPYMVAARTVAKEKSLDPVMPTGTVIVKHDEILGGGANGSNWHEEHGCERVRLNIPTGQGYDLCEGCSPKNHSEPRAVEDAKANGHDTEGAVAYLWGHWWCCEPCWTTLVANGIRKVRLMENSEVLFNKEDPNNIVGKQFASDPGVVAK